MKKIILYFFFILQFLSFSAKSQSNDCIEPFASYDTLTVNGNFLKYHLKNKKAKLEYGNNKFRAFLPHEFDCDIADNWVPRLKYDNTNFLLLHYGCGSTCWGLIMLPLNSKEQIRTIMYDLTYDPGSTRLVYTDNENLLIENLSTRKIQTIKLPECLAANMVYCIDSVYIMNSELHYQFYSANKVDGERIKTLYIVKIK